MLSLVRTLVKNGHDADVAVGQAPPVHEVPLVAKVEAFNPELSRYWFGRHPMGLDAFRGFEQPGDVAVAARLERMLKSVSRVHHDSTEPPP